MKQQEIRVGIVIPTPPHELLIEALCAYYKISVNDLFLNNREYSTTQKRGVLFYLMNDMLGYSYTEIARVLDNRYTRQAIESLAKKSEYETKSYLHLVCACKNIKPIYSTLLQKQDEWLNRVSQESSTTACVQQ